MKTAANYAMEVRDYYMNNEAGNYKSYSPAISKIIAVAQSEAYRAGQIAMRERAAMRVPTASLYVGIRDDIRALPIEEVA